MKAGRVHHFGPPNAIVIEIPRRIPGKDELIVRVAAAGVGPWDALIHEGESVVQPSLPIILGADLAQLNHREIRSGRWESNSPPNLGKG